MVLVRFVLDNLESLALFDVDFSLGAEASVPVLLRSTAEDWKRDNLVAVVPSSAPALMSLSLDDLITTDLSVVVSDDAVFMRCEVDSLVW